MSGSQLYNLPIAILQNVIEALTEDMFTVKSTMENKDFFRVIRKTTVPGADIYIYISMPSRFNTLQHFLPIDDWQVQ
ncbi:hypothetical protein RMCBS344292_09571 [Rhizopus microsporus]|nr:hypothetical protein RMCBS344292_09571 [Rhizopus microsporus]